MMISKGSIRWFQWMGPSLITTSLRPTTLDNLLSAFLPSKIWIPSRRHSYGSRATVTCAPIFKFDLNAINITSPFVVQWLCAETAHPGAIINSAQCKSVAKKSFQIISDLESEFGICAWQTPIFLWDPTPYTFRNQLQGLHNIVTIRNLKPSGCEGSLSQISPFCVKKVFQFVAWNRDLSCVLNNLRG